jgi:malate dehydrogenase (oxaloacetate-decarboxylating)(NADP+)
MYNYNIMIKNIGNISKKETLKYHLGGKLEIKPKKPFESQRDLSLAYTPGVGYPCLEIQDNPETAYDYTTKGNLVAIITNGTAVLGLGDIGALPSKPVMEGKAILFKKFADIDAFDIELDEKNVDKFCEVVKAISPTFGGINLEDIKAPECFEIEKILKRELDIPVMHDDQHGTAIVSSAALLNALELTGKDIKKIKIVISGAGASAIACGKLYKKLGAENIVMCDSKGVIKKERTDLSKYKKEFAIDTKDETLFDALVGADVFIGLSRPKILTKEIIKFMNTNPIIFVLSNPVPEILPEDVFEVRQDAIIATGRSDYPNQINNVMAFPFIFRGSLDVRARDINDEMVISCVKAISDLAKEPVPDYIKEIYHEDFQFGKNYIIPKPFDKRLFWKVSSAVAKAAVSSGSARVKNFNVENYIERLKKKIR